MSIQEQRRAAFESAYPFSDLYLFVKDRYIANSVRPSAACLAGVNAINEAWFYWNAALDSVVVELPDVNGDSTDPLYACAYAQRCRNAITATGLKVAP